MSDPKHQQMSVVQHAAVPDNMHPLVRFGMQALAANPDPGTLRELLTLQREWEAGEAKKAFVRALVALKADLPVIIAHDKTVDFKQVHYTHTSLGAVMTAIDEPLRTHGFAINWLPHTDKPGMVGVTCRLTHIGGHAEESSLVAPVDSSGAKSPAQGTMSTITLLRRYTLLSMLGIATADMGEPGAAKPAADSVNAAENLKCAAWLQKQGKTRADAEALVGRSVPDWTAADLAKIGDWADPVQGTPGADAVVDILARLATCETADALAPIETSVRAIWDGLNSSERQSIKAAVKECKATMPAEPGSAG
jgi:hypothetical protein